MTSKNGNWRSTGCILCSINCGLEVQTDGRRITRVRGDRAHPGSRGYLCEKPQALDRYQNGRDRLRAPLRRRPDGSFEEVSWDTAITEVAARLAEIRDTVGGDKIFYYGGGAQGNHLGGAYGRATRATLGSVYTSNALAQEKTGEFWVDGKLYGRPRCHTSGDFEHAEVAVFVGKNPWQSHGFPRARAVLRAIAKDPARSLIVIDPRRTETAALADIHLQVRPGGDAFLLAALLAVLVEEDLLAHAFLDQHCADGEEVLGELATVPIADYCARADVDETLVRTAARRIAAAESVSVLEDLGIQQAPHSTLNSYLEKLLYLLTGNFGKRGAMNIHSRFASLGGGGGGGQAGRPRTSPVGGHPIITGLIPCNVIADEILTDHPDRFRAMVVESSNPAHSLADSQRMREALRALDFVVVIDVAMSETAREADYVLAASSQYEKWECTFFNLEFPENVAHLRRPLFEPLPETLPEPEIHARLVRALGGLDGLDLAPLRAAADKGLDHFAMAFAMAAQSEPRLMALAPVVLYETLGPTLPEGAATAAVVWGLAQTCAQGFSDSLRRAGLDGAGPVQGNALFRALLDAPSGLVFTVDDYEQTWRRIDYPDGRVHLTVPALMDELRGLRAEPAPAADDDFPLILAAGERRSSTANTLYRDPAWRKERVDDALRVSPADAARLGLQDGQRARLTTRRGAAEVRVTISDTLRPGHVTLPNGQGLSYPGDDGRVVSLGVAPNELTDSRDRDPLAGTPWHKHVRARLDPIA
ncbi:molybdopterin-dependent oxidoreductase [Haliangium sp.]|uniref:molybdopterin-dependent oxidoreductase n=1 Tax=Haliangium sp. TaxID=2663208 RepID=UPI003D0BDA6D